mmetsp:Transcript_3674/g.14800  ORF Transcript_3674/g.14800 Transcript_3674/m.14800 type:complete len:383 (-) Transcript_3674:440-1588(-)
MVVVEVLRGVLLPVLLLLMVVRARVVRGVHLSRSLLLILPRVRMPLHVGIRVLLHVLLLLLLSVSVVPGRGVVPRVYVILWGPARGLEHGDVPGIGALRPSSNLRLRRLTPRGLGLSLERGPSRGLASFPRLRLLGGGHVRTLALERLLRNLENLLNRAGSARTRGGTRDAREPRLLHVSRDAVPRPDRGVVFPRRGAVHLLMVIRIRGGGVMLGMIPRRRRGCPAVRILGFLLFVGLRGVRPRRRHVIGNRVGRRGSLVLVHVIVPSVIRRLVQVVDGRFPRRELSQLPLQPSLRLLSLPPLLFIPLRAFALAATLSLHLQRRRAARGNLREGRRRRGHLPILPLSRFTRELSRRYYPSPARHDPVPKLTRRARHLRWHRP